MTVGRKYDSIWAMITYSSDDDVNIIYWTYDYLYDLSSRKFSLR